MAEQVLDHLAGNPAPKQRGGVAVPEQAQVKPDGEFSTSAGSFVLVDASAEDGFAAVSVAEVGDHGGRSRWSRIEAAVGAVPVAVAQLLGQDAA